MGLVAVVAADDGLQFEAEGGAGWVRKGHGLDLKGGVIDAGLGDFGVGYIDPGDM